MQNIKMIYKRFTNALVKDKTLLFSVTVQDVILILIVLIYANAIISNGKTSSELNYEQVKFFYNLVIYMLMLIVYVFTPYFLSGTINKLVKDNTVEYLLSTYVKLNEIVCSVYLRGFFSVVILIVSAFPIACISLYFGGVGILKAAKIVLFLLSLTAFFSSICLYISSIIREINAAVLLSYIIGIFVMLFHISFLRYIINSNLLIFFYVFFAILSSIILIFQSSKCKVLGH